MCLYTELVWI